VLDLRCRGLGVTVAEVGCPFDFPDHWNLRQGFGFRVSGFGLWVSGFDFGLRVEAAGFSSRVQGFRIIGGVRARI